MDSKVFNVGVDLGGTNIKFGIVDEDGVVVEQEREKTLASRGSTAIIATIIHGIDAILKRRGLSLEQIASIGLGIPGTTDSSRGVVLFAPNIFWRNVEVSRVIQRSFNVPVYVAQDTRAAVWGEYLVGAGRGYSSIASLTLGTGVGCGMVLDGKIFHGALNAAGEFGHQLVEVDGSECNCGRCGCLEAYAGGLSIVRQAREKIVGIEALLHKNLDDVEVFDVFHLANEGNPDALRLTSSVVRTIGIGLVNLVNLTSVELISISGGVCNAPSKLLLDPLIEFVRSHAYESTAYKVQICRSALGEDAPLIGAALLYRERAVNPRGVQVSARDVANELAGVQESRRSNFNAMSIETRKPQEIGGEICS